MTHGDAVVLRRLSIPLRRPHAAAHGVEATRDLIVVEVQGGDGVVGWGECSTLAEATYTAEHTAGAWALLRDELVPAALRGARIDVGDHPMATAGLATALLDVALVRAGRSLAEDLAGTGPPPQRSVPFCAVIGRRGSTDDVVAEVAERIEGRVTSVKLKVTPAQDDLVAVEAVRDAWPDLDLSVDFNGTADGASLARLDRLGLAYIEQPAPADQLDASARFAARLGCPIALDESVGGLVDLEAALRAGAGSILNVKPAKSGGPRQAVALAQRARAQDLGVFVGGMVESGVGRAAALAVAAQDCCTHPTDLGPSLAYVDVDVTDPLEVDEAGRMRIPTGPGIGRSPHPDRLDSVTVDRLVISA